jgi:hypothetical protein
MMANCAHHPSRPGAIMINGKNYCSQCRTDIATARNSVEAHVEPKSCFVWYESGAEGWHPIPGTGCAHWVLHQLNRKTGAHGDTCLDGYSIRVKDVIFGRKLIDVVDVKINDIYVTPKADHTGLVSQVITAATPSVAARIVIKHDSSGQGKVAENEFATYFHGKGRFYR